jgi:NitT/TauT family transport system substrate-binding protein
VTWESYLSEGRNVAHGHLLTDSSERPGLIGDCLATQASIFNDPQERLPGCRTRLGCGGAVRRSPSGQDAIMARRMGDWLEDPAIFAEMGRGVAFYDADKNREYFGTPEQPGQIHQTMEYAIDVWSDLGMLKVELTPADVIAHGILDAAPPRS